MIGFNLQQTKRHFTEVLAESFPRREAEQLMRILLEDFFDIDLKSQLMEPDLRIDEWQYLNLGGGLAKSLTGLIPNILGGLRGFIKDQDGDGDIDLKDIMLSITGGGNSNGGGLGSIIGAATSILGGLVGGNKK